MHTYSSRRVHRDVFASLLTLGWCRDNAHCTLAMIRGWEDMSISCGNYVLPPYVLRVLFLVQNNDKHASDVPAEIQTHRSSTAYDG